MIGNNSNYLAMWACSGVNTMIVPCLSVEGDVNEYSAMKISSDQHTWRQFNVTKSNYLVQPSVIRPQVGVASLLAYMRDRRAQHIYSSTSTDDGECNLSPCDCHVTDLMVLQGTAGRSQWPLSSPTMMQPSRY